MTADPYQAARVSAARLAELTGQARHDVAVILGSGWAPAADALGSTYSEVPVDDLGGFPQPTVGGHSPTVRSLSVGGVQALVFLGRVHLYEEPRASAAGAQPEPRITATSCRAWPVSSASRAALARAAWYGSAVMP